MIKNNIFNSGIFKLYLVVILLSLLNANIYGQTSFKKDQLKFPRVRNAFTEKKSNVDNLLKNKDLSKNGLRIYLRAFKDESEIELWAKDQKSSRYQLVKTYEVCSKSGNLGPKRASGDYQVPEGFYRIDRFNPASSFYLSLGINYPNKSDKILGKKNALGGDIFIHGNCVTIGCLPITDDQIMELYVFAIEAKTNNQNVIPVTIFPAKLSDKRYNKLISEYPDDSGKLELWADLKKGFDYFNEHKTLPSIGFLSNGRHRIN